MQNLGDRGVTGSRARCQTFESADSTIILSFAKTNSGEVCKQNNGLEMNDRQSEKI